MKIKLSMPNRNHVQKNMNDWSAGKIACCQEGMNLHWSAPILFDSIEKYQLNF